MGIFQRAFLSVIRKLGKSVVLFLVLLVVSTFVLVGLSTKRTSDTAALELRHTLGGNFGLVINKANSENNKADENGGVQYTGSSLDDSVIEKVMSISGIEQYNAYQNGESEVLSSDGIPLELIKTNNQYDEDERLLHMATSESNSFSEKSNYFQKEIFQLTEGKHIGDGDTSIALISKDLAAVNHLKVGDKIMLKTMNGGAVVTLTIAGLFEIKEPQVNAGLAPPPSLYQNRIFTDNKTAKELYTNGKGEYKGVNFYVDDPAQLSNIIESVKENVNIAWDDFSIETADAEYRRSAAPLEKMSSMLSSLLLCIVVGSLLALSLMLALWMKERVHEIGVLLAMGFDKIQIIGQHIVEILLIAIVAFGISYFAGAAAANTAGNYLMTSACEQSVGEQDIEVTGKDTAPIEIDVTAPDFFAVCGIGSLVAVLSVFVSSVPVVRLKPKEILTKMN